MLLVTSIAKELRVYSVMTVRYVSCLPLASASYTRHRSQADLVGAQHRQGLRADLLRDAFLVSSLAPVAPADATPMRWIVNASVSSNEVRKSAKLA